MQTYIPEMKIKYIKGEVLGGAISSAEDAVEVLRKIYDEDTIEFFETAIALFLDTANQPIGWMKLGDGGRTMCIFDMRTTFATALISGATKIILSHNHPSGNLHASHMDIEITEKFVKSGKLFDMSVLDHIIVTKNGYRSMVQCGDI